MDIVIIAQYLRDINDFSTNNSRFVYLANLLIEQGHQVEIITSDFNHGKKKHFKEVDLSVNFKVTPLHEPGYKKNVCLKRFYSHYKLSKEVRSYLTERKIPDCIYCAVPSLDVAYEAAKYCERKLVKFIVDIQDLWPEAFEMVIPIPAISKTILHPLKMRADYIYKTADKVAAVSDTYVERALKVNCKCDEGKVVFLGTDLALFDKYRSKDAVLTKNTGEFWIGYTGTLGHSYDLKTVFDAMKLLTDKPYYKSLKMVVMGDGVLRKEFETYAGINKLNVVFTGMLLYPEMVATLCKCDCVVNPIVKGSAASIINKHADYAASAIPVISTQENTEYCELVDSYTMGFNCRNGSDTDIAEKIKTLVNNRDLCQRMGRNARVCAQEKFDRSHTYKELVNICCE